MDIVMEILHATLDPCHRKEAEVQLLQVAKINGFGPTLLKVIMANEVPIPVRQAGVIYFKNLVTTSWHEKESDNGEPVSFFIHEQDRAMIREPIVDAIVQAEKIIRVQLAVCLKTIVKHDFPARWPQFVDKILVYLQNSDPSTWLGALLCLDQLISNYELSNADQTKPLIDAMKVFLPIMYKLMVLLQEGEQNELSALLQDQILKNFYGLINLKKITLWREILTREMFSNWMEILRRALIQPVPDHTLQVDEDERANLPWWQAKKWAVYSLCKSFEKIREEYEQFSEWYVTTFTGGMLDAVLKILDYQRNNVYVAPIVLNMSLLYIAQCASLSYSWELLEPHMSTIIQYVLFPLMCYSEADEELWKSDPIEFIRLKYYHNRICGNLVSPVAASLLLSCCKRRKCKLMHTMNNICMQILNTQGVEYNPRQRDGAFYVIGILNQILKEHKICKNQIETFIDQYVITEVNSPSGHMRARTYWVLQCYAEIKFKSKELLKTMCMCAINSVLTDTEIPVKVEAAIALRWMLNVQKEVQLFLEPHVKEVTLVLLNLIRETKIEELDMFLEEIVSRYTDIPLAVEITEQLSTTFLKILETGAESDKKAMAALGLGFYNATVLNVIYKKHCCTIQSNTEIMAQIEKIILRIVEHVLYNNLIEFYCEAMILLYYPTSESISEDAWKILEIIYKNFENHGFEYFPKMMPVLHNYISVDTEAFLSNKNHVIAIFNMAKAVLSLNSENESEVCAAKILEVIVLKCNGKIDDCLYSWVELVLSRMSREVEVSLLRTMLLQVLISILYCNPQLLFKILGKIEEGVPNASITQHFIRQWIQDKHCFIGVHDRKLCILGICKLLEMGSERPNINEIIPTLMPFCLVVFDGLVRVYDGCDSDEESSSEIENDDYGDEELLSSDKDDLKYFSIVHLKHLAQMVLKTQTQDSEVWNKDTFDTDDDDYVHYYDYLTPLDDHDCQIDEFVMFKNCMSNITTTEPSLYNAMTSCLSPSQHEALNAIFVAADRRKALQESKLVQQSENESDRVCSFCKCKKRGRYPFNISAQVPRQFQFGS